MLNQLRCAERDNAGTPRGLHFQCTRLRVASTYLGIYFNYLICV